MTRRLRVAPLLIAALLATFVCSHTATAAPRHAKWTIHESTTTSLVRFLPKVWTALRSIWEKAGSSLDPFGNPQSDGPTATPTSPTKEGSSLDPFGNPNPVA
jgi:hypothetical protein